MNNIFELENNENIIINSIELIENEKKCIYVKYFNLLKKNKDIIDDVSKEWETFKKYMNPYELIYSPHDKRINISNHKPISRSFFKMWEILIHFNLIVDNKKLVISNIAEGPGGFIEAILKYRKYNKNDIYYSNTLYPSNRNIPSWNKFKKFKILYKLENIYLSYCDLYNYSNVISYISNFKNSKADLITSDGGFDYSSDYNNQEQNSNRIIYTEIITALSIQKINGSFVIKIFDTFNIFTIKCIYLLYSYYKKITLFKPFTSRVANSEKYIICKNYKGINDKIINNYLDTLKNFPNKNPDIKNIILPNEFIHLFDKYNENFTNNQINFINKTLNMIKNKDSIKIDDIINEQIIKAKEWCELFKFKN